MTYKIFIHSITDLREPQMHIVCHLVADCRNDFLASVGNLEGDT